MESITAVGQWWLPDDPDNRVAGTLKISRETRPTLELIGSFHDLNDIQREVQIPIVLGLSNGKYWCLAECRLGGSTAASPGFLQTSISAAYAVATPTELDGQPPVFSSVSFEIDYLSEWLGKGGLRRRITVPAIEAASSDTPSFTADYTHPAEMSASLTSFRLSIASDFSTSGKWPGTLNMKERRYFVATPPVALNLHDYLTGIVFDLQNLVTFGVGTPASLISIEGQVAIPASTAPSGAKIYFRQNRSGDPATDFHPLDMRFAFAALGDEWGARIDTWLRRAKILGPVFNLYFSTIYATEQYLESRFISLAQAIETYHRRTKGGRIVDTEVYETLRTDLTAAVNRHINDRSARESLKGKLLHLNEPSLRRRVRELVDAHAEILEKVLPDTERFTHRFVELRNHLTHFSSEGHDHVDLGELHWLAEEAECVLDACLLDELGLPASRSIEIFGNSWGYRHLRHHARSNRAPT
jgi:hypothetical protein